MGEKPRNPVLTPKELAQQLKAVIDSLRAERKKLLGSNALKPITVDVAASVDMAKSGLDEFVVALKRAANAEQPKAKRKYNSSPRPVTPELAESSPVMKGLRKNLT